MNEAQKRAKQKYKAKVNRITIDFYPTEKELYDFLQNQPNKQGYIKTLITLDKKINLIRE